MAVNCAFPRQTPAVPALNSYSIGPSKTQGLNQDLAALGFIADPRSGQAANESVGRRTRFVRSPDVRFWHKADITIVLNHVRFRR